MKLALKEILYGKKKYFLIESILIFMTFMVLFLSGLANGLQRAVSASIENQKTKEFILSEDAQKLLTLSSISNDEVKKLEDTYKNNAAALNIYRGHLQKSTTSKKLDVTYFAIDPKSFLEPVLLSGKELTDNQTGIILDDSYADNGIKIGDKILDSDSGISFKVTGFTKDAMYGHTAVAYITQKNYVKIMQSKNPSYTLSVQSIALKQDSTDFKADGYTALSKQDVIKSIPGYEAEQATIQMILWVLLFMSAAILGVFFYILTIQKEKQFGVLKAIGMQMNELQNVIASQVFLLAFVGMLFGNAITIGLSKLLPKSMPFYLQPKSMLLISFVFLLISVLGSLISTRRIAKVDPMITIGGNDE